MTVGQAKRSQVASVGVEEPLPAAVVTMGRLGLRRLPVLLGERVVGIVTAEDVRRHLPRLAEHRSPWDFTFEVAARASRT